MIKTAERFLPVNSSTIESYSINGSKGVDLLIKFKNGSTYKYKSVGEAVATEFEKAPSKGKYFAASIRDKFVTEKLDA